MSEAVVSALLRQPADEGLWSLPAAGGPLQATLAPPLDANLAAIVLDLKRRSGLLSAALRAKGFEVTHEFQFLLFMVSG